MLEIFTPRRLEETKASFAPLESQLLKLVKEKRFTCTSLLPASVSHNTSHASLELLAKIIFLKVGFCEIQSSEVF